MRVPALWRMKSGSRASYRNATAVGLYTVTISNNWTFNIQHSTADMDPNITPHSTLSSYTYHQPTLRYDMVHTVKKTSDGKSSYDRFITQCHTVQMYLLYTSERSTHLQAFQLLSSFDGSKYSPDVQIVLQQQHQTNFHSEIKSIVIKLSQLPELAAANGIFREHDAMASRLRASHVASTQTWSSV